MQGTQTGRSDCQCPAFFPGFAFNGNQSLAALSGFYGLERSTLVSDITLAEYLARKCPGMPRSGHRVALGSAELVALEVERGVVTRVALSLTFSPLRRLSGWQEAGCKNRNTVNPAGRCRYNVNTVAPQLSAPPV